MTFEDALPVLRDGGRISRFPASLFGAYMVLVGDNLWVASHGELERPVRRLDDLCQDEWEVIDQESDE